MDNSSKRLKIGFAGSIAFHLFLILLLAFTGLFHFSKTDDRIIEVAVLGGGGGGGQKPSDPTSEDFAKARAEALKNSSKSGQTNRENADSNYSQSMAGQPSIDDIVEQLTKEFEKNSPTNPVLQESTTGQESNQEQSKNIAGVSVTENTGSGGGYGTGQGTGYGSGQGPGSGSGSGGGHGAGEGTGIGDGIGSGVGTGSGGGYAGGGTTTVSPAIPPRLISHQEPSYPSSARSAGIEGTTTVRMLVGADGGVDEVTVDGSSGSDALDAAAVSACYKWSFNPAKNGMGQAISCYIYVPITFRLR